MRAVELPSFGEPEVLTLREMPEPHLEPQQVSISDLWGVNYADILVRRNRYHAVELPFVPGMEVSGYIHEIGEGVEELHEGQPVTAFTMRGGYAEFALAQADLTFPLEGVQDSLDLATAAAFPSVVLMAYDMLTYSARYYRYTPTGAAAIAHHRMEGNTTTGKMVLQITEGKECNRRLIS